MIRRLLIALGVGALGLLGYRIVRDPPAPLEHWVRGAADKLSAIRLGPGLPTLGLPAPPPPAPPLPRPIVSPPRPAPTDPSRQSGYYESGEVS